MDAEKEASEAIFDLLDEAGVPFHIQNRIACEVGRLRAEVLIRVLQDRAEYSL